jgi:hypothetical protein
MAKATVVRRRDAETIRTLLDSPEVGELIADLELSRWTGRPGYPIRAMVGMALVKGYYVLPVWTRVAALVSEHDGLRAVIGCTPSIDACYRFTAKLRDHQERLTACLGRVLASLKDELPELGQTVAIDGSDLPAYANGQRFLKKGGPERTKYSDPDASWGHRSAISVRKGGGFYGYKIHAAIDTATGLPLAWEVRTAKDPETPMVPILLDQLNERGMVPNHAVLDKGYDGEPVYTACESRGIRPIICLKQTQGVKDGKHKPPKCLHGEWTFAGSDAKRGASKWRCPTAECTPLSVWIKADRLHTLVPRSTDRWGELYRQRGSVEREFGYLKHEWGLLPLRVRSLPRVRLHVDLTILARLGTALAKARGAVPLAA